MDGTQARPPRDWRWWCFQSGRALIFSGFLVLSFAVYQLWGTGIETARSQRALEKAFNELLATAPTPGEPATTTAAPILTTVAVPTTAPAVPETSAPDPAAVTTTSSTVAPGDPPVTVPAPEVAEGDPLARIEIPKIGVDDIVVAGVQVDDLRKGPGHYPDTPLPGQLGNAAIAGHRTTYGAPFNRVDELAEGDEIVLTTVQGRFVYKVTGLTIVAPTELSVLAPTEEATLTLTSCHPKYSARQRIIVKAVLDDGSSSAVQPPSAPYGTGTDGISSGGEGEGAVEDDPLVTAVPAAPDEATPTTDAVAAVSEDAFARGWFSDRSAIVPSVIFGLAVIAVYSLGWLAGRGRSRGRRWLIWAAFTPVFAVTLFLFFERFSRLLPPNL